MAIGFAVNLASGLSEKFDNFGRIPIAKPFFFEKIYKDSIIFASIVLSEIIILCNSKFLMFVSR